jgi:hypothetical protein
MVMGLRASIPGGPEGKARRRYRCSRVKSERRRNTEAVGLFPRIHMTLSHVHRLRHLAALAVVAAALMALLLLAPGRAGASATQQTLLQDDSQFVFTSDAERNKRLDEARSLGVDIIKFRLDWNAMAPSRSKKNKPKGFNGADPAEYNASRWVVFDKAIGGIVARGMRPYVMIGGRAPRWASKDGVTRPNAREFKKFVKAVGTRYSGKYKPSPLAAPLPHVRIFSVWNEPNLRFWLAPQYSHGIPVSPKIYRQLLRGANQSLDASGHKHDDLLFGELQPYARGGEAGHEKTHPLTFLRELACVDDKFHPYTGNAAKQRGCKDFKPLPGTAVSYHPYTLPGGPDIHTPDKNDASVNELGRVVATLDKLSHRNRIAANNVPIWISEFGYQTDPPDPYQTPIKKVPGFLGEAEMLAYHNPQVMTWAQYPLVDDPSDKSGAGFQSGLRQHNGKKKKGVYKAFELPLFADLRSGNHVEVFGGVRAAKGGEQVKIESKLGKAKWKKLRTATLNSQGYFDTVVHVSSPKDRHFRFHFRKRVSRSASVHAGR